MKHVVAHVVQHVPQMVPKMGPEMDPIWNHSEYMVFPHYTTSPSYLPLEDVMWNTCSYMWSYQGLQMGTQMGPEMDPIIWALFGHLKIPSSDLFWNIVILQKTPFFDILFQ